MKPEKIDNSPQLFTSRLSQILNPAHELLRLAQMIDWGQLEATLGECYDPEFGRPGNAARLMAGLHILKHTFNESDESVVARWVENPYWQYFCGYEYMQHEPPIDPSSMTYWRKRVGAERVESLLKEVLAVAVRSGQAKAKEFERVNIDTTVQEKAIAFPTDARLYCKMSLRLAKLAKARGIKLRQSYVRVVRKLLRKQAGYAHAKQYKRARAATRKLKTILGRLVRDIERKRNERSRDAVHRGDAQRKRETPDEKLALFLERAERLLAQKKDSKNKLYSIDAPEVCCISKGKAHKRYEFGCKVSVATSSAASWVVGVQALEGNPYDGHTLQTAALGVERTTGRALKEIFVDRGYRGHDYKGEAHVYIAGRHVRDAGPALRKRRRRRSAIEPKIGHMKYDCRMGRNFLKYELGDKLNALLAGIGVNVRKLLAAFSLSLFFFRLVRRISVWKQTTNAPPLAA